MVSCLLSDFVGFIYSFKELRFIWDDIGIRLLRGNPTSLTNEDG